MFSGLSSFVYYPATTALARSLHVSIQSINFKITAYQVLSGLAPLAIRQITLEGVLSVCLPSLSTSAQT